MAVFGAFLALWGRHFENNVYAQIGLIMLIGLAPKNAKAVREQARLRYEATILTALQEVSNALIARQKYAEARLEQSRAVQAYEVAVQVSRERYRAGRASYYEVLQEQQLLFPAENALVQTELNQFVSLIQLYRALGGGWEADSTPQRDPHQQATTR